MARALYNFCWLIRKSVLLKVCLWLHRTIRKLLVRMVLFSEREDELAGKMEETRHISKLCMVLVSGGAHGHLVRICIIWFIFEFSMFGLIAQSLSITQNLLGLLTPLKIVQKWVPLQGIQTSRLTRAPSPSLRPFKTLRFCQLPESCQIFQKFLRTFSDFLKKIRSLRVLSWFPKI